MPCCVPVLAPGIETQGFPSGVLIPLWWSPATLPTPLPLPTLSIPSTPPPNRTLCLDLHGCWGMALADLLCSIKKKKSICLFGCAGSWLLRGLFSSWGAQASHCGGSSCGSRALGSVLVATGVSCSLAWDIFPDQGSNLCLLHWQEDSWPLSHWGSPCLFLKHLPGHLRLHFLTLTRENLVSEAQDLSNYCACFAFSVSLLKLLKARNVLFLPSAPWS